MNVLLTNVLYLLVYCIFLLHVATVGLLSEIWLLITQLKKGTLGCARTLSEALADPGGGQSPCFINTPAKDLRGSST